MAFFTLEDRIAEIECVAFARQYKEASYMIRNDSALYVRGTVSLREDEPPKILVNRLEELVEDRRFRPEEHVQKEESQLVKKETVSNVSDGKTSVKTTPPKRLFLRVPSAKSREFCKALNLLEIFDGTFPTFFFFADEKRYETEAHGLAISEYVVNQLKALLGEENVILK